MPIETANSLGNKAITSRMDVSTAKRTASTDINIANNNINNLKLKNNNLPVDEWNNLSDQDEYQRQLDLKSNAEQRLQEAELQGDNLTGNFTQSYNTNANSEINSLNGSNSSATTQDVDLQDWKQSETPSSENPDIITETKVNGDAALFTGVKISADNEEKLFNWRANLVQTKGGDELLTNFLAPWDWRFGYAYSNTQSIGNKMPYGPEWVGSPSLMNPYALIRFDNIASSKHHNYILDQVGIPGFASLGFVKQYVKIDNVEENTTTDESGKLIPNQSALPNNVTQGKGGTIYADPDGSLYQDVVDLNVEIWKTDIQKSKNSDMNNVTVLQVDVNGANDTKSPRPGVSGHGTTISNDLVEEYWFKKIGWVKDNVTGKYDAVSSAEKNEVNARIQQNKDQNQPSSQEDVDWVSNYEKQNLSGRKYLQNEKDRGWKFADNLRTKRYIQKPNTAPQQFTVKEPYLDELCNPENWIGKEQFLYDYTDFLYTKYYGMIPNNHLITLRRFPVPVTDSATIPGQEDTKDFILPVAKAVTFLGEETGNSISELLSMSFKMNWKPLSADVQNVQGNEQGAESGPFSGVAKVLGVVTGEANFGSISGWDEQRAKFDPYESGMYQNRVYGPVNAITSTMARERGLEYQQPMNVKFNYSLKSIGGANPKAVMLDILANMLALTYNNANFWGGAIRYFPNKPAYPFLGAKKGMDAWYNGDVTGFIDGLGEQFSDALGGLGDILKDLFTNPIQTIKNLAGKGAQIGMAMHQKKNSSRPAILGFKALLTGEPVGEWHLVVGNPFNPVVTIGNLIVTNTKISFSDQFGIDDFPDEMTVEITLEHGKSRDKGDIESMFNRGGGRLHYAAYGQENEAFNKTSATSNSKIDTSWKPGASSFRPSGPVDVNGGGRFTGYLSDNVGKSSGDPTSAVINSSKKVYDVSSSKARALAFKMGFKTGS